jgi:hypothetical protein
MKNLTPAASEFCSGHVLADTERLSDGRVMVRLFAYSPASYMGPLVEVRVAKSDRGARRIMDNWSKTRGACPHNA